MELLDDLCHMEYCFGPFVDIVSFSARYVHILRLMHHSLSLVLLGEEAQVEAWFGQFGDSANPYAR